MISFIYLFRRKYKFFFVFFLIMQPINGDKHLNFEGEKNCFASFVKVKWLFTFTYMQTIALIFVIVITTFQQLCLSAIIRCVLIQVTLYLFYRGRLFPFHYLCLGISHLGFYLVFLHYFSLHFDWVEVL